MGKIVSAYATSHILFDPKPAQESANRVYAGMQRLGRMTIEAGPDLIFMITSEHMNAINLQVQPPFCVGISDEWLPLDDMLIPERVFRGHREFALALVQHAANSGFDIAMSEGIRPDHGTTLPLLFIKPWGAIPVVPFFVNVNMTPAPTTKRCFALADMLRDFIETRRPAEERVAVIGSGGLSHWLCIPKMGTIAEEFDRECMDTIAAGHVDELVSSLTSEDIREKAGNGGLELLNWIMMAAMVLHTTGEKIYYEPISAWQTGLGGIAMNVRH
jgi:hypothetical protein